ncbi:DUF3325 domain-containing protein [Peristeroidobacter soli]|jgi:hypothetical protein|uniref:DUF3325 domain-containing protein n=1 Tax=Peristeroidobacter soli TaxID=2497877 RepID=UPI00101B7E2B|nr:DUF3325 domain-containing protein [Peristeroidobacter soli]
MSDAALLAIALLLCVISFGWLALAMDAHWRQVWSSEPPGRTTARWLRILGWMGLAASLALCLRVDHASMASLVWVMNLASAALIVAMVLAWTPRWLRLLVPGRRCS